MNRHQRAILRGLTQTHMMPGEDIEIMSLAKIGKTPVKKNVTAMAASLAISAATGPVGMSYGFGYTKKPVWVILTSRQLLLFAANANNRKLLARIPRESISIIKNKNGLLFLKMELAVAEMRPTLTRPAVPPLIRLTFPPIPISLRITGRKIASALGTPATPDKTAEGESAAHV